MLNFINLAFTIFFVIEAAAKIGGFGMKLYLADPWNTFDFIVVLVSLINTIVDYTASMSVKGLSVLRAFRVVRLFRIAKQLKQLRTILEALLQSLPSLVRPLRIPCR